jgi:hypothetical protein
MNKRSWVQTLHYFSHHLFETTHGSNLIVVIFTNFSGLISTGPLQFLKEEK